MSIAGTERNPGTDRTSSSDRTSRSRAASPRQASATNADRSAGGRSIAAW
jgi:hypothetical protein